MKNEFGYIDDSPFKECNTDKQIFSTITIDDEGLEFKINGIEKSHEIRIWNSGLEEGRVIGYESFNSNRYDPEKLIRSMGILFIK